MCLLFLFQPSLTQTKSNFFIGKFVQIAIFGYLFSYFLCYKNKVFNADDLMGLIADYYKLFIILNACIIAIIEPLFNYNCYMKILTAHKLFFEILSKESNVLDIQIRKRIKSKWIKIYLSFCILYFISEILAFKIYYVNIETRYIYITTNVAAIFLYLKFGHLLYHLVTIEIFFKAIEELLKSSELNKARFNSVLEMYDLLKEMISEFNSAGLGQLVIFLGNKYYIVGECYWLTIAFMLYPSRYRENFGLLNDEIFKLAQILGLKFILAIISCSIFKLVTPILQAIISENIKATVNILSSFGINLT